MTCHPLTMLWLAIITASLSGCHEPDARLLQLTQQTLAEQARQNERLTAQSQQIAEASRQLVVADAQARDQMLQAHAQLQQEFQANRKNLDEQRDRLEQERREIAEHRYREPLVAQAITTLGITLACLSPLALAGYVLYVASHGQATDAALNELLVSEIVADKPLLLPAPPLTHAGADSSPT